MLRIVTLLCAALAAGWVMAGSTVADASGYRRCHGCGPLRPTYNYRTVQRVSHRIRYRDVSRTRYVRRVQRVVHVTRIQPIVQVHEITRVHHRTVPVMYPVHVSRWQVLPARTYVRRSVRHSYDCGCGY